MKQCCKESVARETEGLRARLSESEKIVRWQLRPQADMGTESYKMAKEYEVKYLAAGREDKQDGK